jgi:hypothetical protein
LKKKLIILITSLAIILFFFHFIILLKSSKNYEKESLFIQEGIILECDYVIEDSIVLNDDTMSIINKYSDLNGLVKSDIIKIPESETLVPQGVTLLNGYIVVSAYSDNSKENSKAIIFNRRGNVINTVTLENNSHVGGIAFDKVNNLIWVPGNNGTLNAYDAGEFLEKEDIEPKYIIDNLSKGLSSYTNPNRKQIDYISIQNDYLYIGNFSYGAGTLKMYKISTKGDELNFEFINTFKLPSLVQGITFYEYNNQKYLLISRSFGRYNNSSMVIYKFDENITDYRSTSSSIKVMKLPPMLEQISIYNNELFILFESSAKKYVDSPLNIDSIFILDIKGLIDGLN